jgi:alpha-L-fucosidase
VEKIISQYQPDCLFYHNVDRADFRWGGSESGKVGYPCWSTFPTPYSHSNKTYSQKGYESLLEHGDRDGNYWMPAMADTPLRGSNGRHEWFWEPGDENAIDPLSNLIDMYDNSVGHNATLVFGLTPSPEGTLPKEDSLRLQEFGEAIQARYAHPIAAVGNIREKGVLKLPGLQTVNCCILQEDIRQGERVTGYKIEYKVKGKWATACEGTAIGHKRIQFFPPIKTSALRLVVSSSKAVPILSAFKAYYVKGQER